jgi:hypothetical protein
VDRYVVHLAVLAIHQQHPAIPADKIDGVITRVEDRRDFENVTDEWWGDEFETETRMRAHRLVSPAYTGGSAIASLSQPGAWHGPQPVMVPLYAYGQIKARTKSEEWFHIMKRDHFRFQKGPLGIKRGQYRDVCIEQTENTLGPPGVNQAG